MAQTYTSPLLGDESRLEYTLHRQNAYFEAGLQQLALGSGRAAGDGASDGLAQHGSVDTVETEGEEGRQDEDEHATLTAICALEGCRGLGGRAHAALDGFAATHHNVCSVNHAIGADGVHCVDTMLAGMARADPNFAGSTAAALMTELHSISEETSPPPAGQPRMSIGSADDWDHSAFAHGGRMPFGRNTGDDVGGIRVRDLDGAYLDRFIQIFNLNSRGPSLPHHNPVPALFHGDHPVIVDTQFRDEDLPDFHPKTPEAPRTRRPDWLLHSTGDQAPEPLTWRGRLCEVVSLAFIGTVGWAAYKQCPVCVRYAVAGMGVLFVVWVLALGVCLGVRREREAERVAREEEIDWMGDEKEGEGEGENSLV